MGIDARFVHTSIVAREWSALARFYQDVFGCVPIYPERDLAGQWLTAATGVPEAHIRGIHLRLPGYGDEGPTLEIFQYNRHEQAQATAINRPGIAHIAFAVGDVDSARRAVLEAGGGQVGEMATVEVSGAGGVTFVYVTDPEGNVIELQRWQ
jgi:catechol 2,3-dioxygenase-like lactoylglutathione lyase family enzyme